jgi:hypothetical protein
MQGRILKLIGTIAIASWAISSPLHNECRLFSTPELFGAEKSGLPLLKARQKQGIGDEYFFVYDFDKKPQMGTIIIKIQVFTKGGGKDTSLEITGSADMPP